jgi:ferrous iron transport protein B
MPLNDQSPPRDRQRARRRRRRRERKGHSRQELDPRFARSLVLVGNLKVGKSTIFSHYAGRHRQHMTYPGTGVEMALSRFGSGPFDFIVDAPGFYSLQDKSEDANVLRDLLVREGVGGVLLVLDAKNVRRGLSLALELSEFSIPMVVALNMEDEARQRGIHVNTEALQKLLGVPVVTTVASEGRGLGQLKRAAAGACPSRIRIEYPEELARRVEAIAEELKEGPLVRRGLAYLLLTGAPTGTGACTEASSQEEVFDIAVTETLQAQAESLGSRVVTTKPGPKTTFLIRLGVWTRKPLTGIPIAILMLGLVYLFVGWFGATFLVDLLEGKLFGGLLLPVVDGWVSYLPWEWLRQMLTGPFGLITVGITLSLAIVLPVLATFFLAFALLEDSGYLPRLSLLMDRSMRKIGLNGKGVLPLVMGFSCVTMAILTTRMLNSKKQRIIATFLLILTMPCAPLLSVMMVILGKLSVWATFTLFGVLFVQFLIVGILANLLIPGNRPDFVMELPPMRTPRLKNALIKSGHQLVWFLKEAIPYFIIGTFILFLLDQAGMLTAIRSAFQPISEKVLGLPRESADVFLMTIVRREAGAAILAQQMAAGIYTGVQALVTLVVMTTIVPCINSVLVMYKERGVLVSTGILLFVLVYSVMMGGLVNAGLCWLGVSF